MPGEFSLTNYFLFIGKKSCSGDKLLTNRKRRFCWEPVLILAALRSLILFSLPRLLTRLPPNPHPASPSVVSLIPVPPRTPPHLILQASLPSPFWFPFLSNKPWTAARSPLPPRESAETDRVISGPERQLAREAPLEVSGFVSHWCHFFPAWLSLRQRKASSWGSSILAVSLQKSQ